MSDDSRIVGLKEDRERLGDASGSPRAISVHELESAGRDYSIYFSVR